MTITIDCPSKLINTVTYIHNRWIRVMVKMKVAKRERERKKIIGTKETEKGEMRYWGVSCGAQKSKRAKLLHITFWFLVWRRVVKKGRRWRVGTGVDRNSTSGSQVAGTEDIRSGFGIAEKWEHVNVIRRVVRTRPVTIINFLSLSSVRIEWRKIHTVFFFYITIPNYQWVHFRTGLPPA